MKFIRPLVLTSILIATLPAFAQTTTTAELPKDGGKNLCQTKASFDPKLKISSEQREKLSALRDQFILESAGKKAQLKVSYHQLFNILRQPTVDKEAAISLQTKINGLKDELANERLSMRLASSDVFTPEQRAQFDKMHTMRGWQHHRQGGRFFGSEGGARNQGGFSKVG